MSIRTPDSRIRGWIALVVVSVFFGVPVLVILALLAGSLSSNDLKPILEPWVLYMGPLTGAVFGYYFGSSGGRKSRFDDDAGLKNTATTTLAAQAVTLEDSQRDETPVHR